MRTLLCGARVLIQLRNQPPIFFSVTHHASKPHLVSRQYSRISCTFQSEVCVAEAISTSDISMDKKLDSPAAAKRKTPLSIATDIVSVGKRVKLQHCPNRLEGDVEEIAQALVTSVKKCRVPFSAVEITQAIAALKYYPNTPLTSAMLDALSNCLMHVSDSLSEFQLANMYMSLTHISDGVVLYKALGLLNKSLSKVKHMDIKNVMHILASIQRRSLSMSVIKDTYSAISKALQKNSTPLTASQTVALLSSTTQFNFVGSVTSAYFFAISSQLRKIDFSKYDISDCISVVIAMEHLSTQVNEFVADCFIAPLLPVIKVIPDTDTPYKCVRSLCMSVRHVPAELRPVDALFHLVALRINHNQHPVDVDQLLRCVASLRYHDASTPGVKAVFAAINSKLRYLKRDSTSKKYSCNKYLRAIGGLANCVENTLAVDMLFDTLMCCVRRYNSIALVDIFPVTMAFQGMINVNPRLRQHALDSIMQRLPRKTSLHPIILAAAVQAISACYASQPVPEQYLKLIEDSLEPLQRLVKDRTQVQTQQFSDIKQLYIRLELFLYFNRHIHPIVRIRLQQHADAFHQMLTDDRFESYYREDLAQSNIEKRLVHCIKLLLRNHKVFAIRELSLLHGFDADIIILNKSTNMVYNIEVDGTTVHRGSGRELFAKQRDEYLYKKHSIFVLRIATDMATSKLSHDELLELASSALNNAGVLPGHVLRRELNTIKKGNELRNAVAPKRVN